jgi:hypothetical protein
MSQAGSTSDAFNLLRQATTVLLLFQGVFLLTQIFSAGASSGGMSAILGATLLQLGFARRLSADPPEGRATAYVVLWRYGALTLLAVITLVQAFDTYAPDAVPNGLPTLIAMLISALIALKGAVLGKLKPNRVVGLRLRWTRQSRLAWDLAHRLMGRILFFGGLIGLVAAPFVPMLATFAGIALVVLIGITSGTIKSWRVWQRDPERISGV